MYKCFIDANFNNFRRKRKSAFYGVPWSYTMTPCGYTLTAPFARSGKKTEICGKQQR